MPLVLQSIMVIDVAASTNAFVHPTFNSYGAQLASEQEPLLFVRSMRGAWLCIYLKARSELPQLL